jgi:peptidoglycan/LPS O-acetylase OafA/YrhL
MNQFIWGAVAALSAVAATFMWKFWRRTDEPLFRAMALGFGILALHWVGLGVLNPTSETRHGLYLVRFAAFALIIAGIVTKNRRRPSVRD